MTRCPRCRAILPERTVACPFCDGEPEADLLGLAQAAGTPDPGRFVAAAVQAAAQRPSAPVADFRPAAPVPRAAAPLAPVSGVSNPREGAGAAGVAVPGPEIVEDRVSRHDEPIGFDRSPTVQAVIIVLLVLFLVAAIVWFWN